MDILNQITKRISMLSSGEKWIVSAHNLLISRADFQSISVYLTCESKKGQFSIDPSQVLKSCSLTMKTSKHWFEQTSVTIIKH